MANSAQARKRARQNVVSRHRNQSRRSSMRTAIKSFLKAVGTGDVEAAQAAYRSAVSSIDRTARRGIEHRNKANRLKSRLNARLKAIATS